MLFSLRPSKVILVAIVLFISICKVPLLFAQSDSTNLQYYFDDGGIARGTPIKTDLIAIIHGDLPLLTEIRVKNSLMLELGPGLILPYYVHDFLALGFTDNRGIINNKFGYSARIHLKWYAKGKDKDYWGMQFYHRAFQTINVNEWTFTKGDQRILGKRLLIDIGLGIGLRFQNSMGDQYMFDPDFNMMPIVPLILRFGYVADNR